MLSSAEWEVLERRRRLSGQRSISEILRRFENSESELAMDKLCGIGKHTKEGRPYVYEFGASARIGAAHVLHTSCMVDAGWHDSMYGHACHMCTLLQTCIVCCDQSMQRMHGRDRLRRSRAATHFSVITRVRFHSFW